MSLLIFFSLALFSVAISFAFMNHPLAMGLTLITQTIMICLMTGLTSGFGWFSYILFLIFLGATLVLFIYVASLASNEIFKINPIMTLILLMPLTVIPLVIIKEPLMLPGGGGLESSFLIYPQELTSVQISLNNMYNPTSASLTGLIVWYLLLTLIVVVKLSSSFFGPLRMS